MRIATIVLLNQSGVEVAHIDGKALTDFARNLAEGYDREDSAQRGEPNPWNFIEEIDEVGDSATWTSERVACALAGIDHATRAAGKDRQE